MTLSKSGAFSLSILVAVGVSAAASCLDARAASAQGFTLWADADASGGPGLSGNDHAIVFGAGALFLAEDGVIYSSTGPAGGAPGTFSVLLTLPPVDSSTPDRNEGLVYFSNPVPMLVVGEERTDSIHTVAISGAGAGVTTGAVVEYDGESNPEQGDTGEFAEFDTVEGLATFVGTPIFDDANATPLFSAVAVAPGVTVNGNGFPIVNPNWSGRTLLAANEDDDNVIAFMILDDGTISPVPGVALAQPNDPPFDDVSNVDGLAVTPDGRFAYAHDESDPDFYRFDLRAIDSTGGSSHIREFNNPSFDWVEDGLLAPGDGFLYAVADGPDGGSNAGLMRIPIDSATGDLGAPETVGIIKDGQGTAATGDDGARLSTHPDGILISDGATNLVFLFSVPTSGAPALGPLGIVFALIVLLALGYLTLPRRAKP